MKKSLFPQVNVHQTNIKVYYNPLYHLGACRDLLGTGLLKANISERLWYKAIFVGSKGSRIKKNTWFLLKLEVFMPKMKMILLMQEMCQCV